MNSEIPPDPTREGPSKADTPSSLPGARLNSSEMFRGRKEIQIEHEGEIYRLRVTRSGKLILTK